MSGITSIVMLFIGMVIAVSLVANIVMPTVTNEGGYVWKSYTYEGEGQKNSTQTITLDNKPVKLATTPVVYYNTSKQVCDASEILPTTNWTYSRTTGVISLVNLHAPLNNSCFNVSYTGAQTAWDTGSTALWTIVGIAVIAAMILSFI